MILTIIFIVASMGKYFSKLKLIKSYLRSIMSQEILKRLNNLIILSIEKDLVSELEYKHLISDFISQKARKINFK